MNSYLSGGAPLPAGVTLASIKSVISGNDIQAIRNLASTLANYNQSGDLIAFDPVVPPTVRTTNGDPQGARDAGANCLVY